MLLLARSAQKSVADVVVKLEGLKRFQRSVSGDMRSRSNGPVRKAITQWAAIYRAAMLERYTKASRGSGDWPPLKPNTIARRRKGKGVGPRASILVDTGILRGALSIEFSNKPGQLQQDLPFGVRVGYGGPAQHDSGGPTVAQIANWHQTGAGRLPVREIIVSPTGKTLELMQKVMEAGIRKAAKNAARA